MENVIIVTDYYYKKPNNGFFIFRLNRIVSKALVLAFDYSDYSIHYSNLL